MEQTQAHQKKSNGMFAFVNKWCRNRRGKPSARSRVDHDLRDAQPASSSRPACGTTRHARLSTTSEEYLANTIPAVLTDTASSSRTTQERHCILDNIPPRHQAKMFVEYFSDSLFDLEKARSDGVHFTSHEDMGVHRFWQCTRTSTVYAEILAPIVQEAYTEFCAEKLLVEHKWRTFAAALNEEMHEAGTTRKPYTNVRCEDTGKFVRLRCYRFPVPSDAIGEDIGTLLEAA